MIIWLIASAFGADALDTLPAKLAGISGWPERAASVQALLDAETAERERERLSTALAVVQLLAEKEPGVDRGRLRALIGAALSKQEVPRSEARKAASLGAPLPEIPDDEGWIPRVPVPLAGLEVAPLVLVEPDLGATGLAAPTDQLLATLFSEVTAVGWPLATEGELSIHGTLGSLYGAVWADQPGFGVDVSWRVTRGDEPVYEVVTRGFDPGPLDHESARVLLHRSLFNLLAQDALVATLTGAPDAPAPVDDAPLDQVELGTLCLYRKKHQDARPLVIDVGGQDLKVFAGSWGCLELPAGTRVHSEGTPGEAHHIVASERLVMQVTHADNVGWSTLTAEDGATFDKLSSKGKVTETMLAPSP